MHYWRIAGIDTPSGTLDVTAIALSDGEQDYPAQSIPSQLGPSVTVDFDLGASVNVTAIKMTAGTRAGWPDNLLLFKSSTGESWDLHADVGQIVYPGSGQTVTVIPGGAGTQPRPLAPTHRPFIGRHDGAFHGFALKIAPWRPAGFVPPYDHIYGGDYRIVGTTKIKGSPDTPVARKVVLLEAASHNLARIAWSDEQGNYLFDRLKRIPYTVIGYDHHGLYRAVIADNLLPEPRP